MAPNLIAIRKKNEQRKQLLIDHISNGTFGTFIEEFADDYHKRLLNELIPAWDSTKAGDESILAKFALAVPPELDYRVAVLPTNQFFVIRDERRGFCFRPLNAYPMAKGKNWMVSVVRNGKRTFLSLPTLMAMARGSVVLDKKAAVYNSASVIAEKTLEMPETHGSSPDAVTREAKF